MPLAWRLARRELRGGTRGFRIFLACLALGVAVIAAVGSLAAAIEAGLRHDARALLGGDVDLHLALRPASAAERSWLAEQGRLSETADLRAMARLPAGDRRSLIELKAVDRAYPLYGTIALSPEIGLAAALADRGAVVEPALLDRLRLRIGDAIRIGAADFTVRATIAHEPDAISGAFAFGPKVIVAQAALADTGLIVPGTLVGYSYRLRLPAGADAKAFAAAAGRRFPDAGWRIRDIGNAAPGLERLLDRLRVFLTLVGLTALLVGGVGIGNAVRGYLAGKIATIATLKCLGAPARLIFATYLAQTLTLAAGGIALGLVIGALAPSAIAPFLPARFPVAPRLDLYPEPLLLAAAFGLLATLAFALWPIAEACEVAPAGLFRAPIEMPRRLPRPAYLAAVCAAGAGLAGLAVASTVDRATALWFIAGAAGALLLLRLAALAMAAAARRAARPRRPTLRLALANLHRPGAPTGGIVASLGLGLTVLVAIAQIEGNLAEEVAEDLPARAPTFFFIDLQPDQAADFDRLLAGLPGVTELGRVASLRGRITKLNGVSVEQATVAPEAEWALRSERGVTPATSLPAGSRLVAGTWWPADYGGPPLLSFDAELARGMHLQLGDTLTVNVLGRDITATIANLREIDWTSLGINFTLVLTPNALAGAPRSFIATARAEPGREDALERAVTDRFPNVSAIAVKDALASLAAIIAAIATAMRAVAAITLAAGVLVLAGATAAEHRRRVYEAVVLKVLGATRRDVTAIFLMEYGLLGLAAAAVAGGLGTLAAWLVLTRVMHAPWSFLPLALVGTTLLATSLTLALGFAGTWRALGAKAAPLLRNE
jgi:putative ABC transport system permease protein